MEALNPKDRCMGHVVRTKYQCGSVFFLHPMISFAPQRGPAKDKNTIMKMLY